MKCSYWIYPRVGSSCRRGLQPRFALPDTLRFAHPAAGIPIYEATPWDGSPWTGTGKGKLIIPWCIHGGAWMENSEDRSDSWRCPEWAISIESPSVPLHKRLQPFFTSMTNPIASGRSECRMGFAPTEKRRLSTTHAITGSSVDADLRCRLVAQYPSTTWNRGF